MEAYKIWATLNLKGDATTKLDQFTKAVHKSDQAVTLLNSHLKLIQGSIGKLNPLFKDMASGIGMAARELKPASKGMSDLNRAVYYGTSRIERMVSKVGALNARLRATALDARMASSELGGLRGTIPSMRGGGGVASRGGRQSSAHRLAHAAAFGLGAVAPEAAAVGGSYYLAGGGAVGGIAAGVAGAGILAAQGFQNTKTLSRQRAILMGQGFSPAQIGEFNQMTMNAPRGVSPTMMGESLVASQMGLRNWGEAKTIAPDLAKITYAAKNTFGGMTDKQTQDLIRFAEFMNISGSPQEMRKWLNVGAQMTLSSGGTIMPGEQATFLRQASGAVAGRLTPEAYLTLEPIMQEYRGTKLGTAFTTGLRAMLNPQMSNFAKYHVKRLEDLGLWDSKTGRMKSSYLSLLTSDPDMFLRQVWLPALAKKGITSPEGIRNETMGDMPRTFGTALNLMYNKMPITDRSRALSKNLLNSDEFYNLVLGNEAGAQSNLSAAWERLTVSFGKLANPAIIKAMNALADLLDGLSNMLNFNKQQATGFMGSLTSNAGKSLSQIAGELDTQSGNGVVSGNVYLDKEKVGKSLFSWGAKKAVASGTAGITSQYDISLTQTNPLYNG